MNRGVDVLVIGAGAAGLAAARELSEAGLTAIVVEARDRIGGRWWTMHDRNWPMPIELGAKLPFSQREMFTNFVGGYHAAAVDKISARSLAAGDEETDGESSNKQFRIPGGYDDLLR